MADPDYRRWSIVIRTEESKSIAARRLASAPIGWVCSVREAHRTLPQNAKLHAMLTDISQQCDYMGKRRTINFWKNLFVSGWMIATDQVPEIVPGLEGEFVNIRESTANMGVRDLSSVIEYVSAWGANEGVKFRTQACPDAYLAHRDAA